MLIAENILQTLVGLPFIGALILSLGQWSRDLVRWFTLLVKAVSLMNVLRVLLRTICLVGVVFNAYWVVSNFVYNYTFATNVSEFVPYLIVASPLVFMLSFYVAYCVYVALSISIGVSWVTLAWSVLYAYNQFLYTWPIMRLYFLCIYSGAAIRWYVLMTAWFSSVEEASLAMAIFSVSLPVILCLYVSLMFYLFKIAAHLDTLISSRIFALIYFHMVFIGLIGFEFVVWFDNYLIMLSLPIYYMDDFIHSYTLVQLLHAHCDNEVLAYMTENRDALNAELNAEGKHGEYWREQVNSEFRAATKRNAVAAAIHVPRNPSETLAQVHVLPWKFKNGLNVSNNIFLPKWLQRAGWMSDSAQVVDREGNIVYINNLREDKVSQTNDITRFLDKVQENAGHKHRSEVNVLTRFFYTTNPIGLGQSILTKVPTAENAYVGLLALTADSSKLGGKDLFIDIYSPVSARQFGLINSVLEADGVTPSRMEANRNNFIRNVLGYNKHIKHFAKVPQTNSRCLSYHNARVIDIIAKRNAYASISSQAKNVLMQIVKKV